MRSPVPPNLQKQTDHLDKYSYCLNLESLISSGWSQLSYSAFCCCIMRMRLCYHSRRTTVWINVYSIVMFCYTELTVRLLVGWKARQPSLHYVTLCIISMQLWRLCTASQPRPNRLTHLPRLTRFARLARLTRRTAIPAAKHLTILSGTFLLVFSKSQLEKRSGWLQCE